MYGVYYQSSTTPGTLFGRYLHGRDHYVCVDVADEPPEPLKTSGSTRLAQRFPKPNLAHDLPIACVGNLLQRGQLQKCRLHFRSWHFRMLTRSHARAHTPSTSNTLTSVVRMALSAPDIGYQSMIHCRGHEWVHDQFHHAHQLARLARRPVRVIVQAPKVKSASTQAISEVRSSSINPEFRWSMIGAY